MLLVAKSELYFRYLLFFAWKKRFSKFYTTQQDLNTNSTICAGILGYILVTVFSLLNCCGLLVLLGLNPYPGTPFHDLTTGVILALSTLILLIISLGVITSKWCIGPPPDNRVHVC